MCEHELCASISYVRAWVMCEHKLCVSISYVRAWVMCEHKLCVSMGYVRALWGPEGSGRLRLPDFVTWALEGDRLSAKRTGRFIPRIILVFMLREAESTTGTWIRQMPRKKSPVTPPWIEPGTFRLVAQCLDH
jgi:hypothetical protein